MKFEWDPHKAEINFRKQGVFFDEAGSVFLPNLDRVGPAQRIDLLTFGRKYRAHPGPWRSIFPANKHALRKRRCREPTVISRAHVGFDIR